MLIKLKNFKLDKKLIYILGLAVLLILPGISQIDFLGDNSHYTLRSVGYVDHMFSDKQTTPLNWYDKFPWWANLSFHDHPFLLFFVQHLFLGVHESIFFAKLPYILFSLGAIILIYQWAKENYNEDIAFWSAVFLSLNSIFLYTVRTGFMEAGVIFFIALAILFFYRFLKNQKYWPYLGTAVGLCFLAKYNTFFIIPSFLAYVSIKHRHLFKKKELYYSILTAFLVSSPIIIYNLMLYKTVGHFDYQFSRLFHVENPWVASNVQGIITMPQNIAILLGKGVLFPYLFLSIAGLGWALYRRRMLFVFINLVFLTLFFMLTGGGTHYFNIYNIFLVPPLAYLIVEFRKKIKNNLHKNIYKVLIFGFCGYLFVVAFNSHILVRPFAEKSAGWLISAAQSKNYGIYQLDKYLSELIEKNNILDIRDGYRDMKRKKASLIKKYGSSSRSLQKSATNYEHMIVYDTNLNWFAELWPFQRRRFYHNIPILDTDELIRFANDITIEKTYFIKATENTILEGRDKWSDLPIQWSASLDNEEVEYDSIYRSDGKEVFKVYKLEADYAS